MLQLHLVKTIELSETLFDHRKRELRSFFRASLIDETVAEEAGNVAENADTGENIDQVPPLQFRRRAHLLVAIPSVL